MRSRVWGAVLLGLAALAAGRAVAAPGPDLDDALWELQVVPLDLEPAPPLALPALGGGRVALTDLRGRVVMLYFWTTT